MVAVAIGLLLGAEPRVECDLEPGVCYGLEALTHCRLGPGLRFCFAIEEVDPPSPSGLYLEVRAPCRADGKAWAQPRIQAIAEQYGSAVPIVSVRYRACDDAEPRIEVRKR